MKQSLKKEIEELIKTLGLNCSIKEFENKINWYQISQYQNLSEDFIREFKNKVDWDYVSQSQNLSEDFIGEFENKVNIKMQNKKHKEKTIKQKEEEIKEYAKKYNLKYENGILTAYRNHDQWGRGNWNNTIFYQKEIYYRDWHCDMDENEENSFGLGIWPKGDTKVEVKVKDWGCAIKNDKEGKARVWGFKVI